MRSLTEETRNYRQEFKAYYYEKMVNELARFEELRKPELFKYWFCLSLILVAAVVTIFFLNYFSKLMPVGFWEKNGASEPIMMLGFFSAAGFCWLANKVKKDFEVLNTLDEFLALHYIHRAPKQKFFHFLKL